MDEARLAAPAPLDHLADRIRRLARGREALDIAQFHAIGLDEIRSAYGERWPEQKERIQGVAEGFLRQRIDPSDLLVSAGGGFVIIFGGAGGAEAEVAAGQLSDGLNRFFLGEAGHAPAPRFGVVSHCAPVRDLAGTFGAIDFVAGEPEPEAPSGPAPQAFDWRYQPVWDVRRETLSSWYAAPYLRQTQKRVAGYQFETTSASAIQFAAIDEASLLVTEQAIESLVAQGKQVLIGASIHARTLINLASRTHILAVMDRLDPRYFRYRLIKVAGVAPGFPRIYLNEIIQLLKARVTNVVIGAAWDEPDVAGLLRTGASAVGLTIPPSMAAAPMQTLIARIGSDVKRAHAGKARFFVEGEILPAIAIRLGEAGVDNIASSLIWPASGLPDAMMKWPASRLEQAAIG